MKKVKILLVGQPNVGKSSLLNALVGPRVVISNYPGTTVEITRAKKIFNGTKINFIDTPGIYSISDRSEEEKVTEIELFEKEIDGVVIIADATSIERSLYIVLQIMEAGIPTILAVNFVEDARSKGIIIDYKRLSKILRIPVVPINPIKKKGIKNLLKKILETKKISRSKFSVKYDDHIEKAIKDLSTKIKKAKQSKRFVALRILENDEDFYRYLEDKKIINTVKKDLRKHPRVAEDIPITRYGTASFIAKEVTHIVPLKEEKKLHDKIDDVLLHSIWGPSITLLFIILIFGILLYIGNFLQNLLIDLTESLLSSYGATGQSALLMVLHKSLIGLAAGISIALPYVFLFYFILGFLEDTGILSRFIVNMERFFKKMGLPGKSFIPLLLGLGCTVPATRATRILSSKKEQFYTASLFNFIPCSSRIAIIMGIVGFYGGVKLVLYVFGTLFVAGIIWALTMKKVTHVKVSPLLLELPPYRMPLVTNVLAKSWIRMRDFVYVVIPLLAVGGAVYGVLDVMGFVNLVVNPLSPITKWLGLPSVTIIPLIFGFLQKDLTGAMLISVLGNDISTALSPIQIYTFGIASTIGIPCINALGMLVKEFGLKRVLILTLASIGYSLLFVGLIWRLIFVAGLM